MSAATLNRSLILCRSLLALMFFAVCGWTAAATVPTQRGYVSDHAGVLGAQRDALEARLQALEAASGHQMLILTVPTTEGEAIDAYALSVFEQWKPGRKGIDDGVLMVIASDDRSMRIEVGYGLEGELTDVESARILRDVMAPALRQGDFGAAAEQGLNAIVKELQAEAVVGPAEADSDAMPLGLLLMLLFFGAFLYGMSLFLGIVGLVVAAALTVALPAILYPEWRVYAFGALAMSLWLFARWKLLAKNVRKYRLPSSANPALTWLRYYLFSFGFTLGRPLSKREQKTRGLRVSFGGTDDGTASRDGIGGGGRSGGGGASGSW